MNTDTTSSSSSNISDQIRVSIQTVYNLLQAAQNLPYRIDPSVLPLNYKLISQMADGVINMKDHVTPGAGGVWWEENKTRLNTDENALSFQMEIIEIYNKYFQVSPQILHGVGTIVDILFRHLFEESMNKALFGEGLNASSIVTDEFLDEFDRLEKLPSTLAAVATREKSASSKTTTTRTRHELVRKGGKSKKDSQKSSKIIVNTAVKNLLTEEEKFVVNPLTGNTIKRGGKRHRQLIAKGSMSTDTLQPPKSLPKPEGLKLFRHVVDTATKNFIETIKNDVILGFNPSESTCSVWAILKGFPDVEALTFVPSVNKIPGCYVNSKDEEKLEAGIKHGNISDLRLFTVSIKNEVRFLSSGEYQIYLLRKKIWQEYQAGEFNTFSGIESAARRARFAYRKQLLDIYFPLIVNRSKSVLGIAAMRYAFIYQRVKRCLGELPNYKPELTAKCTPDLKINIKVSSTKKSPPTKSSRPKRKRIREERSPTCKKIKSDGKEHRCEKCSQNFPNGHALGGHKKYCGKPQFLQRKKAIAKSSITPEFSVSETLDMFACSKQGEDLVDLTLVECLEAISKGSSDMPSDIDGISVGELEMIDDMNRMPLDQIGCLSH